MVLQASPPPNTYVDIYAVYYALMYAVTTIEGSSIVFSVSTIQLDRRCYYTRNHSVYIYGWMSQSFKCFSYTQGTVAGQPHFISMAKLYRTQILLQGWWDWPTRLCQWPHKWANTLFIVRGQWAANTLLSATSASTRSVSSRVYNIVRTFAELFTTEQASLML